MADILILIFFIGFCFVLYKIGYNRGFNKGYKECEDDFESYMIDKGT